MLVFFIICGGVDTFLNNDFVQHRFSQCQLSLFLGGATEPYIKIEPKNLKLDYNGNGFVTCQTVGNNAVAEWLIEESSGKLTKVPEDRVNSSIRKTKTGRIERTSELKFTNAKTEDSGTYKCQVTVAGKIKLDHADVEVRG